MSGFDIEEDLVRIIEYNTRTLGVLYSSTTNSGSFFQTTVSVHQGCLLSPVLFSTYLEKIMQDTLLDHHTYISIGGRRLGSLCFAGDTDIMADSNNEIQVLTTKLIDSAGAYGMGVSKEKSKVMMNSLNDSSPDITMNGQRLEEVNNFKYLRSTLSKDESCIVEVRIRIATTMGAMSSLSRLWKSSNISFTTKYRLYQSLRFSILLYECET